jgi:Glycine/D-amino acid oxidases (deaminating)
MGLASARALAQRGDEVTVYEQFELGHNRGSSHGASRIFRLSYLEDKWIALAQRAYVLWRELERETGAQLLKLNGLLDAEANTSARTVAFERAGVAYEILEPDRIAQRFSMAYDRPLVFSPDAGISLATEACLAFESSARSAGAAIREHTRIESLDDIDADVVVVTAGGWAPKLLGAAGIELPAKATRESTAYFALPDDRVVPSVIDELDVQEGRSFYALEAPGVGLKAGLHQSGAPTDPDDAGAPDARLLEIVSEWVARRFPFVEARPVAAETCIYTTTSDDRFVLERHGRIVVASACSGHGFKFAPAIGELVAELV